MNKSYATGNVIRSLTDWNSYVFPAKLPTEEWAGNEARSYSNYLRPVANLFENDRENEAFIMDLINGLYTTTNSIISGCEVKKTEIDSVNYYEVSHGAFINGSTIYHIFPACEALAKQIESEYEKDSNTGDLTIKIWYDVVADTYNYTYTLNSSTSSGTANTAVTLVNTLLSALSLSYGIEDHIILPIFKATNTANVYYDQNASVIVSDTNDTTSDDTVFATITEEVITASTTVSTLNGARISTTSGYTIPNSSITNNTVTIGSTSVALGGTETDFTGVNTINNVQLYIDSNGLTIDNGSQTSGLTGATYGITTANNYTLGDACTRTYSTDTSLADNDDTHVSTTLAVKTYVDAQINGGNTHSNNVRFNGGITTTTITASGLTSTSGKIAVSNETDASRSNGTVSGSASIYTAGGIEAGGAIYADGNIVGLNTGTYSKRELKENISEFTESAVDIINTVDVVNYAYKADEEHNHKIGFIADDTHEYLATKDHNIMDQSNCIGLLLKAVQELSAENKALKEQLDVCLNRLNQR